jgi:hypothetical protein
MADLSGKIRLEDTPGGKEFDSQAAKLKAELTPEQIRTIWARLSQRFAAAASGEVWAVVEDGAADSLYYTHERPILFENSEVTVIHER